MRQMFLFQNKNARMMGALRETLVLVAMASVASVSTFIPINQSMYYVPVLNLCHIFSPKDLR